MPKRRTYKKRTKKASSPPFSWKSAIFTGLSGVALALLKKKLGLNTEGKYVDFGEASTATTTTLTATAAITNPIPQGDGTNQRQGNTLRVTSINAVYTIRAAVGSTSASRVRLIIMYQPKLNTPGSVFTAADIVTDTTANIETPYNMNTVGYKILFDKTVEIAAIGQNGSTKELIFNYHPLNHHMEWTDADTAGTAANQLRGYVRAYICTDNAGNPPVWTSYTRVKYVDN